VNNNVIFKNCTKKLFEKDICVKDVKFLGKFALLMFIKRRFNIGTVKGI